MVQEWRIESSRVGTLKIGEPVPADFHDVARPGYFARYIADGLIDEGFVLDAPGIEVSVLRGPFIEWVEAEGGQEPPVEELRAQLSIDGLKISRLMVRGNAPRTAQGTGVGSTLEALRAAHADLQFNAVPPTVGDDQCVAYAPSLPGVYFLFQNCTAAENGARVMRVDLWNDSI